MSGPISLSIVSDRALATIPDAMLHAATTTVAASLRDVHQALEAQAARPCLAAVTVDLCGHSTRDHHLLRLGATPIDALDLGVARYFEGLVASGILRRINAVCLRLLGCETARSPSGQRTMRLLAAILRMPVYATRKRISRKHYTAAGFDPAFQHVLIEAGRPGTRFGTRVAVRL